MSFLFHKKTKKAINWIWGVIAIVIAVGMVLTYSGFANLSQQQTTATPQSVSSS